MGNIALSDVIVRPAVAADAGAIADIYNHYIVNTIVTFEEVPVTPGEMARRINDTIAASMPWLVAERDGHVTGYAYAAVWNRRTGYRFSAETTVYLDPAATAAGIGTILYGRLFPMLEQREFHLAIGGIALPNDASIALHEKFGMTKVAHFREVGRKFNRWIDVAYWQKVLHHESAQ